MQVFDQVFDWQRKIFSALAFAAILLVAADLPLVISTQASAAAPCDPGSHYREAKLSRSQVDVARHPDRHGRNEPCTDERSRYNDRAK
jgi:hypothetical protein